MHKVIEEQRTALHQLCARYHVQRLSLFGSAANNQFDPATSDLDFLVEFQPLKPGEYANAYFGLREELEALFQRPVDLVMASAVKNPYFREQLEATKVELYAA